MEIILRDIQTSGVEFACNALRDYPERFCYFSVEMRVGKTLMTFFTAKNMRCKKVLFITKVVNVKNAKNDYISAGGLDFLGFELDVINYESLHIINSFDYDLIAIDEAHRIGAFPNPNIAAKKIRDIISRCHLPYVIYLSGTPTPESFSQIFHQLWILGGRSPIKNPNFYSFASRFVEVKDEILRLKPVKFEQVNQYMYYGETILHWTDSGKITDKNQSIKGEHFSNLFLQSIAALNNFNFVKTSQMGWKNERKKKNYSNCKWELLYPSIEKFFFSATQKDAGFNADVKEDVIYLDMPERLNKLSKYVIFHNKYTSKTGWTIDHETPVSKKQKIHQIHSGTLKVQVGDKAEYVILDDYKTKPILSAYLEGKKIAVYYMFIAEFELLKQTFPVWTDDHHVFNDENYTGVYLGQFASKREGVSLWTADILFMFNVPESSVSYRQSRMRMSVKDRTTVPQVTIIMSRGGIEEKIYRVVKDGKSNYTARHFKKFSEIEAGKLF